MKVNYVFNSRLNAKTEKRANQLVNVSNTLAAKKRVCLIPQRARMHVDKSKGGPRESTPPALLIARDVHA